MFSDEEDSPISIKAMDEVKEYFAGYDVYINSEVGKDDSANLQNEMSIILIIAVAVIIIVLTLTSKSYMEIAVEMKVALIP